MNCVDRHLDTLGDSTALIWEKDEPGTEEHVSYRYIHKSAIGGLIGNFIGYMFQIKHEHKPLCLILRDEINNEFTNY